MRGTKPHLRWFGERIRLLVAVSRLSREGVDAIQRRAALLPSGARRELIRVLVSPSVVRADLIRQMHERLETRALAEVLMDLEAEPEMRLRVAKVLEASLK